MKRFALNKWYLALQAQCIKMEVFSFKNLSLQIKNYWTLRSVVYYKIGFKS